MSQVTLKQLFEHIKDNMTFKDLGEGELLRVNCFWTDEDGDEECEKETPYLYIMDKYDADNFHDGPISSEWKIEDNGDGEFTLESPEGDYITLTTLEAYHTP